MPEVSQDVQYPEPDQVRGHPSNPLAQRLPLLFFAVFRVIHDNPPQLILAVPCLP
jgi:hypothetical protein